MLCISNLSISVSIHHSSELKMKTFKIISWLLTLVQVIFFLKLIDYVSGDEQEATYPSRASVVVGPQQATFTPLAAVPLGSSEGLRPEPKFLELTQGKRRKRIRTRIPVRASDVLPGTKKIQASNNSTGNDSSITSGITKDLQPAEKKQDDESSRNCPTCASGDCNTNIHQFAVPALQLKIGIAVILIWLAIWFKVWKYPLVKKPEKNTGYPAAVSGGYGGYSSSGGYPAPQPVGGYGGYGDGSSDSQSGVFDKVIQAFDKYSKF